MLIELLCLLWGLNKVMNVKHIASSMCGILSSPISSPLITAFELFKIKSSIENNHCHCWKWHYCHFKVTSIIKKLVQVALEKATAPHSSTLAWKIPWTEEPGGLRSMGSLRVSHNWATSLSLFTFTHWKRKWQPTPVFLPGESQGQGSLVGCRLWGRTESDTTEVT